MGNSRLRRVSDLINQDSGTWNEPLIRRIFYPHDADMIAQLKLPVNQHDDVLAWFPDKLGMFTVKSAYMLALDLSMGEGNGSSSSSPDGNRKIWDVIWRCNVPPKVRVFAWKLTTSSLAVQANRCKRIKNTKPTCEICGMGDETGYHAVMACPKARDLRQPQGIWRPPAPNLQKLNMDASFSEHSKEAWWGGVLRTCNGEIVASAWGQIVNCSYPNEAETAAYLLGIETLCMQPGVNLHLESNCQQLVNNLNSNSVDRSSSCFLLQEIRRALVSCNGFLISWEENGIR
ncbi:hypothetical protein BRADI_1g22902v3 [Brachypodium distachyon]|uniref:Reverse transcriptase zinc-binding domain-containing protein n=1 Tax=Brachypodium distachyon TaxID=15368 RepID=A0A2K2DKN1_BRADI|nr:hypothetical protein BRADI_1g22902v3 [Brachypodium distachyon]